MRTLFGAVAGALAMATVLVAYDLGERRSFSRDMTPMPTTQMAIGSDGVARPYLMPAGQATSEQVSYATEQPVVRRVSSQRSVVSERATPQRSWQKSVLLIGGSAGAGAGLGALMGGKKGALAGAAIGGGAAAIYDQVKRH